MKQEAEEEAAERLLAELLDEAEPTTESDTPPIFPAAPSHAVAGATSGQLPVATALRAEAEAQWCHVCRANAHVWCVDCSNDAFCAQCWRETHAQSWSDAALRRHRTVPCRAARLAAALPTAPPQVVPVSGGQPSQPRPVAAPAAQPVPPRGQRCQTCSAAAHVWCADCSNDPFCARCWREIHAPDAELRKHRTVRIQQTARK